MTKVNSPRYGSLIVTARSIDEGLAFQGGGDEAELGHCSVTDPIEQAQLQKRFTTILQQLRDKTLELEPTVLATLDDRAVSRLQSFLAAKATGSKVLESGGEEAQFGTGLGGGDKWGWMKSLLDWVNRDDACAIKRPKSNKPEPIGNTFKVAMVSDWGTGMYGAPVSAETIRQSAPYDLLLHLGDVYYSGTKEEVRERFLNVWPTDAGKISRALNSNHEMYSGGYGYFELILPAFNQEASYWALRNNYWLLLGLDTAYVDHEIDTQQLEWINSVIKTAGNTKIVLFTHHQPFSRLDKQGPKLVEALSDWLAQGLVKAWYWGHEHECIVYDKHPSFGFEGRCLGNGGVPEPRKRDVTNASLHKSIGDVKWRKLSANDDSPACIVLDGPNQYIPGEESKFGPHGFMTLEFNGPVLQEFVRLPDGSELFKKTIK